MLSLLPDLAPRDSHSLWYTSYRNPLASSLGHDHHSAHDNTNAHHGAANNHRRAAHLVERSPLARLRADEQNLERRRQNVTNFGSAWMKPPGIPKTLHQLREERREQEEHQEAMRREQLAHELAEAEAAGADNGMDGPGTDPALEGQGDQGMDDVQLDGARDLDEDMPEAESGFGLDSSDDDSDDDDNDDSDDGDNDGLGDETERENNGADSDNDERATREQQQLMAQRMREANTLRAAHGSAFYGGEDEVDEEDQAQMIEEEDLTGGGGGDHLDMDADLDDDIPEAESLGGYEHTDTEADLDSSDNEDYTGTSGADISYVPTRAPQAARFRTSMARSDMTQNSVAISDLLSRDGSSLVGSSPHVPRHSMGGGAGGPRR